MTDVHRSRFGEPSVCSTKGSAAERLLDKGLGSRPLAVPEHAQAVADALLHFDSDRYTLYAWVVMPNHVHVLVKVHAGHQLGTIVRSWKTFTAREINERRSRTGSFWAKDYFDRGIRDDKHFDAVFTYIENNPVKANLCNAAEDWPFGSAGSNKGRRTTV